MLAKLRTFSLLGIDAVPVDVEVDVSISTQPSTTVVGLPDGAVRESRHRVKRAIVNSGFYMPQERVVINLAPAELPKQAASFDLPISLGILVASGQLQSDRLAAYAVVGELSLAGAARAVRGALSMAMAAAQIRELKGIIVPSANASEAAVVEEIEVIAVDSLAQAAAFLAGQVEIEPTPSRLEQLFEEYSAYDVDYSDVRGQESVKRAMTIAAAGQHNLLMIGPPGSGKTMLARRLPTILPPMQAAESIETTRIYSAVGRLKPNQALMGTRPFRAPHHTISDAGLVGGGSVPTPGEITLAHHGVLFLDELPEFNRRTLEVLRQPLEEGFVTISRATRSTTFPAEFMLVAALNPCPCGYRGDPRRRCHCTEVQVERYMAKISGPLLDRIDIHVEVPAVPFRELAAERAGMSSQEMREAVIVARQRQRARFGNGKLRYNGQMTSRQIRQFCQLSSDALDLLRQSVHELGLSARAHDRIRRVARTIADLDDKDHISAEHVTEAIQYRLLDRSPGYGVPPHRS